MLVALADTSAAAGVTYSTLEPILTAITSQITATNILGVVAGAGGVAIGFVFLWWGGRKLTSIIMGAFRKGRLKF